MHNKPLSILCYHDLTTLLPIFYCFITVQTMPESEMLPSWHQPYSPKVLLLTFLWTNKVSQWPFSHSFLFIYHSSLSCKIFCQIHPSQKVTERKQTAGKPLASVSVQCDLHHSPYLFANIDLLYFSFNANSNWTSKVSVSLKNALI